MNLYKENFEDLKSKVDSRDELTSNSGASFFIPSKKDKSCNFRCNQKIRSRSLFLNYQKLI